jgi:predicted DNA-binding WGR domain protein
MLTTVTRPAHLHRIDDARNMARFYSLTIQPTLFGGASLIRNWGRIGTKGQIKIETFDEPQEVDCAFIRLERAKRRRGYVYPCNAAAGSPR